MKRNFIALLTAFALMTGIVSFSSAQTKSVAKSVAVSAGQINQLAAQLPASDAVMILDMQRLTQVALPQLLAAQPQKLGEINAKIDEVKTQTGIDLRQFEQLAAGLNFKQTANGKLDYEPIVLARGKYNAAALLALAKVAAKGKYREEKSGAKTLYIFSVKEIMLSNKPKFKTPKEEEEFNKALRDAPAEISATAFDDNTLAIGAPLRVRAAIEGKPRISQDILMLAGQKLNSIMSFGANVPAGTSKFFKLNDNDEIKKNVDAIRQLRGAVDVNDGNTLLNIGAKTFQTEQARNLEETLAGLQAIGKGFLSGMKGNDKQVLARMVENAKITRVSNEVILDVQISGSDLSLLLGKK